MQKITNQEIEVINLLEKITKAKANDAIILEDSVIFVVGEGELGKAIGKQGANIMKLRKILDKNVEIVEYSDEINQFLKNIFYPVEIKEVTVSENGEKKTLVLQVDSKNKGLAIGKKGEKIEKARMLVKRYFDYDNLKIL